MLTASARDRASVAIGAVGIMAGFLGGILIDGFLVVSNHTNIVAIWQFVASAAVGSAAFSNPSYAVLGFAIHFAVSVAWGLIYAALASGPLVEITRRPVISGAIYGMVVMVVMTALAALKHVAPAGPPDAGMLIKSLVAHTVFFGIPVALYVSAAARRPN